MNGHKPSEVEDEDVEDDSDGYFLEPTSCSVNITERIAEANRRLFEQAEAEECEDDRPRRVQFSEKLTDFEPAQPEYCTEDTESVTSVSGDEVAHNASEAKTHYNEPEANVEKANHETCENRVEGERPHESECAAEVDDPDNDVITAENQNNNKIEEVPMADEEGPTSKLLLVLLPREQSSSCESVIGDDIEEPDPEDIQLNVKEEEVISEEKSEPKPRPKSANRGTKKKAKKQKCKITTISPELVCPVDYDKRAWHEPQNTRRKSNKKGTEKTVDLEAKPKEEPKVESEKPEKKIVIIEPNVVPSPIDAQEGTRLKKLPILRPKTSPSKKACCVVKTDLPRYNGLRSEYGLSAEQIKERKKKIAETRQFRKLEKLNGRLEEAQRKLENEMKFSEWLEAKSHRSRSSSLGSGGGAPKVDTLIRSDVYIQKNAAYANKCGVVYAVDYTLGKSKSAMYDVRRKVYSLKKLLENLSPHERRSYRISLN